MRTISLLASLPATAGGTVVDARRVPNARNRTAHPDGKAGPTGILT